VNIDVENTMRKYKELCKEEIDEMIKKEEGLKSFDEKI
jgi:hypothetical protein